MNKLKRDRKFEPCAEDAGDELFANGVFVFNITRLQAFVDAHPEQFPVELMALDELPVFGESHLDERTIQTADLNRPILRAEIAPGLYNVIDGRHRIARAKRDGVPGLPARSVPCPAHVSFLTSTLAYERYVEYWNSRIER